MTAPAAPTAGYATRRERIAAERSAARAPFGSPGQSPLRLTPQTPITPPRAGEWVPTVVAPSAHCPPERTGTRASRGTIIGAAAAIGLFACGGTVAFANSGTSDIEAAESPSVAPDLDLTQQYTVEQSDPSLTPRDVDRTSVVVIEPEVVEAAETFAESVGAVGTLTNATPNVQWPVEGTISDGYGHRHAPTAGASSFHGGMDFAAASGTPVMAMSQGLVTAVDNAETTTFGVFVEVQHIIDGQQVTTLYAHLSSTDVQVGDTVDMGQQVGAVGSTGVSTGPHLHFEVHIDGHHIDPHYFIDKLAVPGIAADTPTEAGASALGSVKADAEESTAIVDRLWPEL